jgi:hypothetical protein
MLTKGKIMSTQTATKIATPLSRKAVLVSVNISQWTARKLDKRVTKETNDRYNAAQDAGRFNKLLIAADHLTEITGIVSKARVLHYRMTQPWADDGPRILPNSLYAKFTDEFRILKRDFHDAADRFAADYPRFVAERRVALNGLFNESDYPKASDIREKFQLTLTVLPFPDAEDFRADLDADTVADIRREIEATTSNVLGNAMRNTAQQIVDTVGHMATKLAAYKDPSEPGKRGQFFFDSLVDNVRDLAELLPAFNLANDPKLTAITLRIQKELCAEDASVLRKNDDARLSVQKSADEIVAAVSGMFA